MLESPGKPGELFLLGGSQRDLLWAPSTQMLAQGAAGHRAGGPEPHTRAPGSPLLPGAFVPRAAEGPSKLFEESLSIAASLF